MTMLNKVGMVKYLDECTKDLSVVDARTKVSLLFGYWAGYEMSVDMADRDSYTALFNDQWGPYEKLMVQLNEIRPVDMELCKSTAALILTTRARLAKGGLVNIFLPESGVQIIDFASTSAKVLPKPITVQEMTLFYTAIEQLTKSE